MEYFGPTLGRDNVSFVRFDTATGAILNGYAMSRRIYAQMSADKPDFLEGSGTPATHYVDLPRKVIVLKQPSPATINGYVLSKLPKPCDVIVGLKYERGAIAGMLFDPNGVYKVTDGTVTLSLKVPGRYLVLVKSVPYLDAEFTVEVP